MKKLCLLLLLSLFLASCGSSRSTSKTNRHTIEKNSKNKVEKIISHAKAFKGTRYKFGGTTKSGMDCSGLVYVSFNKERIALPRVSREMATKGKRISLSKTSKGDLVFFRTNKNRRTINHVGLVVETNRGEIKFIHSTSSKGVIISSMKEGYWKNAFVEVRRVI